MSDPHGYDGWSTDEPEQALEQPLDKLRSTFAQQRNRIAELEAEVERWREWWQRVPNVSIPYDLQEVGNDAHRFAAWFNQSPGATDDE